MHFIIFFLEFVFKTFQNVMKFYYIAHVHVTVPVIKILIFFYSLIFFSGLLWKIIYPIFILQWLVKKAIETREEMGDFIRAFSISQFSKTHKTPEVRYLIYD